MTASASRTPTVTVEEAPRSFRPGEVDEKLTSFEEPRFTKDFGFIPIPKRLQYDPAKPFHFGLFLNIAFGFASTFTVANLYYCQPLLIQLSLAFHVSFSEVSRIPTLIQAGYAVGLLLISPLGDLLRRRQIILVVVTISGALTIGLAVTNNLIVFEVLSFLVGVVTVTPQILLPLAADLAPPHRRASAISVVLSGLLFGVLIARVLAGVIAEFTSWRVVYYFSIGVQAVVLVGCYLLLPDYPSKNKDLTYWDILWTMAKFSVTEPILIQACLINIGSSACFSNFWVTLTFLLGASPYNYSTLVIGLFGLIGMAGVSLGPFVGRGIDKLVPWYASLFGVLMLIIFQSIQVGAGGVNVAAVIIATFGLDIFRQMLQVSLSTAVFSIAPEARARLNAVCILAIFIGQVMGTSVGTQVFVKFGWRAAALFSMGLYGFELFILLIRGPHCSRYTWFGYEGGLEARRSVVDERKRRAEESSSGSGETSEEPSDRDAISDPKGSAATIEQKAVDSRSREDRKSIEKPSPA
ncbi:MFS general substrate transporter [Crucibulum laeve]|uniref:MFS general substrate transporter n=1 Tax=Crucibulum laeve TaxID=68775 RepID=A0A5C3M3K7_9AGAR|nr:MFS general substrate transporter [Crucibulum laeve]